MRGRTVQRRQKRLQEEGSHSNRRSYGGGSSSERHAGVCDDRLMVIGRNPSLPLDLSAPAPHLQTQPLSVPASTPESATVQLEPEPELKPGLVLPPPPPPPAPCPTPPADFEGWDGVPISELKLEPESEPEPEPEPPPPCSPPSPRILLAVQRGPGFLATANQWAALGGHAGGVALRTGYCRLAVAAALHGRLGVEALLPAESELARCIGNHLTKFAHATTIQAIEALQSDTMSIL
eukprot:SAG31_NODE_4190_length_3489_cov_3.603835_2_plen_236_part_00